MSYRVIPIEVWYCFKPIWFSWFEVKGIVHFEINFLYVLAYLKGIQDAWVFVSTVFSNFNIVYTEISEVLPFTKHIQIYLDSCISKYV